MRIFWYFIVLGIVFIAGCGQPKLLGDFSLTVEMASSVPYEGYEELVYIQGQTEIIFEGQGRIREKREVLGGINTVNYYIVEKDETRFSADGYNMYFKMFTESYWYILPKLNIHWYDIENNIRGNVNFIIPIDTSYLEDNQGYLLDFTVQEQTYNLVYFDSIQMDTSDFGLRKPAVFYYHKESGLIKIDFTEGDPWELKQINK